jgi:hypothetical protein
MVRGIERRDVFLDDPDRPASCDRLSPLSSGPERSTLPEQSIKEGPPRSHFLGNCGRTNALNPDNS